MSKLRSIVRAAVNRLDSGGMSAVPDALSALKEAGAVAHKNVGKKDMSPDDVVDWYAGRVVAILEGENWFAVNSIVNALDRFCPEQV